jgi:hypothetical protein
MHMESVPPTGHDADVPAKSTSPLPVGRFSTGIEQLPDSPDKCRVGRFCDGIARAPKTPDRLPVGRFCTGIERTPTPASRRVGSFADCFGTPHVLETRKRRGGL